MSNPSAVTAAIDGYYIARVNAKTPAQLNVSWSPADPNAISIRGQAGDIAVDWSLPRENYFRGFSAQLRHALTSSGGANDGQLSVSHSSGVSGDYVRVQGVIDNVEVILGLERNDAHIDFARDVAAALRVGPPQRVMELT